MTTTTAPAATGPKKTYKKLTPEQKAEAIVLWEQGDHTLEQLSQKYGQRKETLSRFFTKKGVKKGGRAEEIQAKTAAAVEQALTIDPVVRARRIHDTKNETYRILEMLRKLVAAEVVRTRQQQLPLAAIQNDMKAIREAAAAIKICREEAYAVLGIKVEGEDGDRLPDLTVMDLTDEHIADLQAQEHETDPINIEPPAETGA